MLLAAYNFMNIMYPAELLEWVIVDDSDPEHDSRPSLGVLRNDKRVKYVRVTVEEAKPLTVGLKRNLSCKAATGDVFVHLDDDDYLPPHSIAARVTALASVNARCCGSTSTLCFDVRTHRTFYCSVTGTYGDREFFPEPSMMYTRGFWEENPWSRDWKYDEGRRFLEHRAFEDLVDVDPLDNVVAITHNNNMTGDLRAMTGESPVNRPESLFPDGFVRLLLSATSPCPGAWPIRPAT
jgi:hypothetical protein